MAERRVHNQVTGRGTAEVLTRLGMISGSRGTFSPTRRKSTAPVHKRHTPFHAMMGPQANRHHGYSGESNHHHGYSEESNHHHGYSGESNRHHGYSGESNRHHGYSGEPVFVRDVNANVTPAPCGDTLLVKADIHQSQSNSVLNVCNIGSSNKNVTKYNCTHPVQAYPGIMYSDPIEVLGSDLDDSRGISVGSCTVPFMTAHDLTNEPSMVKITDNLPNKKGTESVRVSPKHNVTKSAGLFVQQSIESPSQTTEGKPTTRVQKAPKHPAAQGGRVEERSPTYDRRTERRLKNEKGSLKGKTTSESKTVEKSSSKAKSTSESKTDEKGSSKAKTTSESKTDEKGLSKVKTTSESKTDEKGLSKVKTTTESQRLNQQQHEHRVDTVGYSPSRSSDPSLPLGHQSQHLGITFDSANQVNSGQSLDSTSLEIRNNSATNHKRCTKNGVQDCRGSMPKLTDKSSRNKEKNPTSCDLDIGQARGTVGSTHKRASVQNRASTVVAGGEDFAGNSQTKKKRSKPRTNLEVASSHKKRSSSKEVDMEQMDVVMKMAMLVTKQANVPKTAEVVTKLVNVVPQMKQENVPKRVKVDRQRKNDVSDVSKTTNVFTKLRNVVPKMKQDNLLKRTEVEGQQTGDTPKTTKVDTNIVPKAIKWVSKDNNSSGNLSKKTRKRRRRGGKKPTSESKAAGLARDKGVGLARDSPKTRRNEPLSSEFQNLSKNSESLTTTSGKMCMKMATKHVNVTHRDGTPEDVNDVNAEDVNPKNVNPKNVNPKDAIPQHVNPKHAEDVNRDDPKDVNRDDPKDVNRDDPKDVNPNNRNAKDAKHKDVNPTPLERQRGNKPLNRPHDGRTAPLDIAGGQDLPAKRSKQKEVKTIPAQRKSKRTPKMTINYREEQEVDWGEKPVKSRKSSQASANGNLRTTYRCKHCMYSTTFKSRLKIHTRMHTGERPFNCSKCDKAFAQRSALVVHERFHNNSRPYVCKVCQRGFHTSGHLHDHTRVHTGERPFMCVTCRKTFRISSHLQIHLKIHNNEKSYRCDVCSKSFIQSSQLKVHKKIHNRDEEAKHACGRCGKKFLLQWNLNLHMRTVHSQGHKPYKCDACGKSFTIRNYLAKHLKLCRMESVDRRSNCPVCNKDLSKLSIRRHLMIHYDTKKYICDVCSKAFRFAHSLLTHIRVHTKEKPHDCPICKMAFRDFSNMRRHYKKIHKLDPWEKSFKCNVCQQCFYSKVVLSRHLTEVHTDQRPHKCTECGSGFKTARNLHQHKNVHDVEAYYKCEQCDQKFSQRGNLKVHIATVHEKVKKFTCAVCAMVFASKRNLANHMHTHTGEKPHKCEHCDKRFTQRGTLKRHERVHTGDCPYKCDVCQKTFKQNIHLRTHRKRHDRMFCVSCEKQFSDLREYTGHLSTVHGGLYECPKCHAVLPDASKFKSHGKVCEMELAEIEKVIKKVGDIDMDNADRSSPRKKPTAEAKGAGAAGNSPKAGDSPKPGDNPKPRRKGPRSSKSGSAVRSRRKKGKKKKRSTESQTIRNISSSGLRQTEVVSLPPGPEQSVNTPSTNKRRRSDIHKSSEMVTKVSAKKSRKRKSGMPASKKKDPAVAMTDQMVGVADQAVGWMDQAVGVADQVVVLTDQAVVLTDKAVGMADQAVGLTDQAVILKDQAVGVADQTVGLTDQAVRAKKARRSKEVPEEVSTLSHNSDTSEVKVEGIVSRKSRKRTRKPVACGVTTGEEAVTMTTDAPEVPMATTTSSNISSTAKNNSAEMPESCEVCLGTLDTEKLRGHITAPRPNDDVPQETPSTEAFQHCSEAIDLTMKKGGHSSGSGNILSVEGVNGGTRKFFDNNNIIIIKPIQDARELSGAYSRGAVL